MAWEKVESTGFITFEAEGDSVEGKLGGSREGSYGTYYIISTNEGEKAVPNLAILNSRLQSIPVGKRVKIVYIGELKTGTGRVAKNFDVYVEK
jgi:hypothetical protein